MAQNKNQNLILKYFERLKNIDLKDTIETLNNLKIEDIKNINFKRLFYDIRKSKYAKPTLGIFSASLLSIFVLIPTIESLSSSLKKAKQYQNEKNELPSKLAQLKDENKKFVEIKKKMTEINSSFLRNEQLIFISTLLNEAAKKSNIKINYFSPLLNADSSKLCKTSTAQEKSRKFKSRQKKKSFSNNRKGSVQTKFYEVVFRSNYLDIIEFLKEIQLYDVTIIPYCLEVDAEIDIASNIGNNETEVDSIVIPLNKEGLPINKNYDMEEIGNNPNMGKVATRIVLKIPSYAR